MIEKVLKPMWKATYTTESGYERVRHYASKGAALNAKSRWISEDLVLKMKCDKFKYLGSWYCATCSRDKYDLSIEVLRLLKSGILARDIRDHINLKPCAVIDGMSESKAKEEDRQEGYRRNF